MEDHKVEVAIEKSLFFMRWLMTPFYLGLMFAIVLLLMKFLQHLFHMALGALSMPESEIILGVLALVDMALVANMMLIVAYVGYDHFVSKLGSEENKDHPSWLEKIEYSGLKIKVMGSIAAITAIQLLRVFMDVNAYDPEEVKWMLTIHVGIVVSGLLLAIMDKFAHSAKDI